MSGINADNVQKADPIASKELAIVTLTRIYVLVHPYQTLVREIATPTIPAFATACMALIKPSATGKHTETPFSVVETICDAFSALIPQYPATFRPFSSQIRSATKPYLAPTQSDETYVPQSLRKAARHLVISLHNVAAKSGGSEEWAKLVGSVLKDLHATTDQVFRAVQESWEGSSGYTRSKVEFDGEPHGGGTGADELPAWTGIEAGADRLIGLFQYLADALRYPTKVAVTIPTSALVDAVSRVCLVARLSPKSQTWDQALQINGAIGREEKEELWSVMPDIHEAAFHLVQALTQRLGQNIVPLALEILDNLVRAFKSSINIPSIRKTGYAVFKDILNFAGPTLPKPSIYMLDHLIGACCRDLQEDAGYQMQNNKTNAPATDSKKNGIAANADLFLQPQAAAVVESTTLEADHKAAAVALLAVILSRLPQRHIRSGIRGLIDQTAIRTQNRDAMLASVLNPYKDARGRMYPCILPHLTQQFPEDQGIEILRTNLRTGNQGLNDGEPLLEELPVEGEADEEDEEMQEPVDDDKEATQEKVADLFKPGTISAAPEIKQDLPIQSNPFELSKKNESTVRTAVERATSPPKRKHEGSDPIPPKRQTLEKSPSPVLAVPVLAKPTADEDDDDDDSDESVHLNMELEDDDDEDEEEDEIGK